MSSFDLPAPSPPDARGLEAGPRVPFPSQETSSARPHYRLKEWATDGTTRTLPHAYDWLPDALDAAERMGWTMVASSPAEGRIEATDKTLWYGFKDDIVIRVTPSAGGSKVDVRSVSRVGRSDIGINAQRIRRYLEKLKA